jgi:hypothetical protein
MTVVRCGGSIGRRPFVDVGEWALNEWKRRPGRNVKTVRQNKASETSESGEAREAVEAVEAIVGQKDEGVV